MEDILYGPKQEFTSVWVRDPRIRGKEFWHAHIDYEICIHTNSICFTKKTSCVRRRYSEFVWLRHKLQENTHLMELPELPPKNPFFSLNNSHQVNKRMKGLQHFLEVIVQKPLVLSDSCLHLFLQSQLSIAKMEECASGRTTYSVTQAIQSCGNAIQRFRSNEDLPNLGKDCCDSDCESTSSSGLGLSCDADLTRVERAAAVSGASEDEPSTY